MSCSREPSNRFRIYKSRCFLNFFSFQKVCFQFIMNRHESCLSYKKTIFCFLKLCFKTNNKFCGKNQDLQFRNWVRSKIRSLNFCKMQHYQFLTLCASLQERKLPGGRDEISNIVILSSLVLQCEQETTQWEIFVSKQ